MGIKLVCDMKIAEECEEELQRLGALLFGPPVGNKVEKLHICIPCFKRLKRLMIKDSTFIAGS